MLSLGVTTDQLMLVQSAAGAVYMLIVTLLDGTLTPGIELLLHDVEVSSTLVAWALAITAGTAIILKLVAEHSAVTAIVVTTARKALTLLASFVLFPKHLGLGHPIGAALVFGSAFVAHAAKKPKGGDHASDASSREGGLAGGDHGAAAHGEAAGAMAPSAGGGPRCTNVV